MNLGEQYLENLTSFISSFEDLNNEDFNTKPSPEVWSVGETVEHIYRSEFGTSRLFNGETKASNHDSDAKIKELVERFADRQAKLTAHGPVVPKEGQKDKDEFIRRLKRNRDEVVKLIETQDLSEICLLFQHPKFGYLTRKEWIVFNIAHTDRHKAQIEEIRAVLEI